jgi:hypothetical protein
VLCDLEINDDELIRDAFLMQSGEHTLSASRAFRAVNLEHHGCFCVGSVRGGVTWILEASMAISALNWECEAICPFTFIPRGFRLSGK